MKTIKAIFTKNKQEQPTGRAYSFNTNLNVKIGDLLLTSEYEGKYLQVVEIFDELYTHFSFKNGEMHKSIAPGRGEIKTLSPMTAILNEDSIVEQYNGF